MNRIPIRKEWNNDYFNDIYQGIPINGYTAIIEKMIDGVDVILNEKFSFQKHYHLSNKIIYCGSIDELLNYELGVIPYRSLRFEEIVDKSIGTSVMNFTSSEIPYTRIIDHKMFLKRSKNIEHSIITYEYPEDYKLGFNPYYPILNDNNVNLYNMYVEHLKNTYPNIILGGRLGLYKYLDMDKIIKLALDIKL